MSKRFLTSVDLNQNQLLNPALQSLASPPSSPVLAQVYFDTVLLNGYIWNGSTWVALAGGSSGAAPTTTTPLMFYLSQL